MLFGGAGVETAKIYKQKVAWYVEQFTPSMEKEQLAADKLLATGLAELDFQQNNLFKSDVNSINKRFLQLQVECWPTIPSLVIVSFTQGIDFNNQNHVVDFFSWLTLSYASCKIGAVLYVANEFNCEYDWDNYHEAFCAMEACFNRETG